MESVVLIGGSSSVGKTYLARIWSERLDIQHICVDDLRKQIHDPNLHLLEGNEGIWDLPATELLSRLIQEGLALESHLSSLISSSRIAKKGILLEGEGVVPKLASRFMTMNEMVSIFIIETNNNRLYQTLYERSHAFRLLAEPRRQQIAEMNSLYGRWLRSQAERYSLPWVSSQPWSTLPERVMDIAAL
jgi:2-phosphoglycerate kinase